MIFYLKKIFFIFALNSFLFLLLVIGIQNSSKKSKVNLLISESVDLPIGFIVGSSFLGGSLIGSLLTINLKVDKNS